MDLASLPPALKPILPYLKQALQLEKHDLVMAYFCRVYAATLALDIKKKMGPEGSFLSVPIVKILDQGDKDKEKLGSKLTDIADESKYVEGFAMRAFKFADDQDRAGKANKATSTTFYSAYLFFNVLENFGEPSEEVKLKKKYASWRSVDINNAIKNGVAPSPPPAIEEPESSDNGITSQEEDELKKLEKELAESAKIQGFNTNGYDDMSTSPQNNSNSNSNMSSSFDFPSAPKSFDFDEPSTNSDNNNRNSSLNNSFSFPTFPSAPTNTKPAFPSFPPTPNQLGDSTNKPAFPSFPSTPNQLSDSTNKPAFPSFPSPTNSNNSNKPAFPSFPSPTNSNNSNSSNSNKPTFPTFPSPTDNRNSSLGNSLNFPSFPSQKNNDMSNSLSNSFNFPSVSSKEPSYNDEEFEIKPYNNNNMNNSYHESSSPPPYEFNNNNNSNNRSSPPSYQQQDSQQNQQLLSENEELKQQNQQQLQIIQKQKQQLEQQQKQFRSFMNELEEQKKQNEQYQNVIRQQKQQITAMQMNGGGGGNFNYNPNFEPNEDQKSDAQKYAKWVVSSLQFDDAQSAIKNLKLSYKLLTGVDL
ncbi:hypothetical protein DICPUDRAFT_148752 [Dictyostelium purpureum]|uniref:Vta1/callose synthase N-terminal domain-containing protein n=1 Tax=Dictyostelium purpureum TaxID=5786 RepID=F0ZBX0_DICPU|nr:uncharacterized protein DICPUDRAFT_148752 [Dictyostelium purpureum]EGC38560.1 hypothetical protein DICPUDRAFT_148752 [Dictyostelium purpureum]|eukprot:XP_003284931.1 hypothetical protein DICPUDRAFT_148752 [Dictyostelium purpureum]